MAKFSSFTAKATTSVAACFLVAVLPGLAHAADKPQLTGHWNFNQNQSDDAQQRVDDARNNSRQQSSNGGGGGGYPGGAGGGGGYPGGGGGYPGGGIWPGGGGMGRGGMGRGRGQNNGNNVSSEDWDRLAEDPKYLRIDQRSDQIVVINDTDQSQTFYPDGKKHDDKDANGRKITTKGDWEGSAFVAETKLPHSEKLTQTFRVSEDGKQLYVTSLFEAPSLNGPLSIRRVYDLAKTTTSSAK